MQMQRIATVFAFVTVMAAIASADDEPASNQNDQQERSTSPSKPFVGIGAALKPPQAKAGKQIIEKGCEIFNLQPNQSAALSGELAVGDLIVAVGQGDDAPINCQGREFSEVINLIRGPDGTEVRLTVIPADNRFVKRKVVGLIRGSLQGGKLVGKKAPNVSVTRLADGREKKLSDYLGKIVVLEFWTSTCAPCIVSINTMQAYPEKHPAWGDHVALIALSLDEKREAAQDRLGQQDWRITHNVWGDEKVKRAFDADILPFVVVIDADGKMVAAGDPRIVNVPKTVEGLLSP